MKNDIEKLDKNIILVCIDPISPITSAWRISKNKYKREKDSRKFR